MDKCGYDERFKRDRRYSLEDQIEFTDRRKYKRRITDRYGVDVDAMAEKTKFETMRGKK